MVEVLVVTVWSVAVVKALVAALQYSQVEPESNAAPARTKHHTNVAKERVSMAVARAEMNFANEWRGRIENVSAPQAQMAVVRAGMNLANECGGRFLHL